VTESAAGGPIRVGVLTISDGVSAGVRVDLSGPEIEAWVAGRSGVLAERDTVPDDEPAIERALIAWCDGGSCDLVVTTGGTGFTSRDRTPEATRGVIEREAPGIMETIRRQGTESTPYAALGRGVAGIRSATLIVNLPGSPSGVADGLRVLDRLAEHAIALLREHTTHD